jgi:hypothetical protein
MKMRITPVMKTATVLLIFLIGGSSIFAQTRTINSAGTWSNSGIWQAGNIADVITEDVSIAQNTGVITVGADYTIGAVDMNNGNTLTINSGAHLDVGQAGTPKNFTVGNTGTINVVGTLIIWGDLIISNTLDLNVSPGGILIVKGNVTLGNGGDINISGNVVIGGNFSAGTNTNAVIDGNVAVGGTIAVGNGSTASGTGTVTAIGCSDGGGVFCSASVMSVMPIKLLYFNAKLVDDAAVSLSWATSKEEDFDHFELERANNNLKFSKITEVAGAGYNTEDRQEYTWLDSNPYTGENYYRLKAVDLDGSFEYFKIVSAASSANKRFSIFPNPTNDKSVNYSTNFDFSGNDRIIVMDNMGNLFQQASVSSIEGKLVLSENVKPGLFFVKYVSDNFTQTVRLMVR